MLLYYIYLFGFLHLLYSIQNSYFSYVSSEFLSVFWSLFRILNFIFFYLQPSCVIYYSYFWNFQKCVCIISFSFFILILYEVWQVAFIIYIKVYLSTYTFETNKQVLSSTLSTSFLLNFTWIIFVLNTYRTI